MLQTAMTIKTITRQRMLRPKTARENVAVEAEDAVVVEVVAVTMKRMPKVQTIQPMR